MGTYIFSDLDRLGAWELEIAARYYRCLKNGGARVLNDPAKVLLRFHMLRRLEQDGINHFGVFRPASGEMPRRYPVFVRLDRFHSGMLTGSIETPEKLQTELERLANLGHPITNLMVVEFAAEPESGGFYEKMSAYRIGDQYFRDTAVIQRDCIVKWGEDGVAQEQYYEEETAKMSTVPHEDLVRRVFDLSHIEYGRMDLGRWQGKPQVYEINTNPHVSFKADGPSPARNKSRKAFEINYISALQSINMLNAGNEMIGISDDVLNQQSRSRKWFRKSLPTI